MKTDLDQTPHFSLIFFFILRYSPEHLLMDNVIVVTINYRLHILGFLSLPSKGISGNNGLKDQQMALQWIYQNIASFNGDPENICLFGESAGAMCVHFHVLNKTSRKFIKSAICQSGSAFTAVYQEQLIENIWKLVRTLGCESKSIDDAFETLMTTSVKDLYLNCEKDPTKSEIYQRVRRWRFVIEEESEGAFMTQSAYDSTVSQAGKIKIPIIFGTNDGDGMPRVAAALKMLPELNKDITKFIPEDILKRANNLKSLNTDLKNFYFGNRDVSNENLLELNHLFSDLVYLTPQTVSVDYQSLYHPECKIFLNEFQFDGKLNIQKKLVKLEYLKGACHADDTFYLFGGVLADKVLIDNNSREAKMRKTLCRLWTNFAKYKDPTPDCDKFLNFKWNSLVPLQNQKSTDNNFDFLAINDNSKMVKNLNKHRMDFWLDKFRYSSQTRAFAKL